MTRAGLVLALLAMATTAHAQDCAEGRERTGGFCCWPGQTFSIEAHRCEGAPRCPERFAEHGEACVRRAVTSVPSIRASTASVPTASAAGDMEPSVPPGYAALSAERASAPSTTTDTEWPAVHAAAELHRPAHVHGRDEPLIAMAFTIFDVGWLFGWLGAALDEASNACFRGCQSWPLAFVPLGGGIAAVTTNFGSGFRNNGIGIPFGILSVLLQGIGLVAAAVAVENRTSEIAFPRLASGDLSITLVPSAPGALAGLSLQGTY